MGDDILKRKLLITAGISCLVAASFTVGAFAGSNFQEIKAYLEHGVKFEISGKEYVPQDSTGKDTSPIIYNGTTWVPLRDFAFALGAHIDRDSKTNTISIYPNTATSEYVKPTDKATTNTKTPATTPKSTTQPSSSPTPTSVPTPAPKPAPKPNDSIDKMNAERARHDKAIQRIENSYKDEKTAIEKQLSQISGSVYRFSDKFDYQSKLNIKTTEKAVIQKKLDILLMDDSYEANAQRDKLTKDLNSINSEIEKMNTDWENQARYNNLRDMLEKAEEKYKKDLKIENDIYQMNLQNLSN